jgi:DNA-binding transcriptional LysR family regulator
MELRQLRTFEAVARHRSFTRASEELMVAQPAVSQQVRRLERELGVDLLRRTSRHVALTEPGEVLLAGARRVLAEAASVVDELQALRGLRSGRVAVGAMPPMPRLDVPSLIAAFHALHPAIGVRLDEDTAANALAMLRRGELDLSFAFLSPEEAGAELAGVLLLEEELVVAVAHDHRLAKRRRLQPAALRDETLVAFKSGSALRAAGDAALAAAGVAPRIAFESNELLTVRAIAALGLAVAILPRGFVDVPQADVVGIPLGSRPVRQPVSLLWRAGERLSPAATAFRDFVQTGSLSSDAHR